jgi:hypothetical protein
MNILLILIFYLLIDLEGVLWLSDCHVGVPQQQVALRARAPLHNLSANNIFFSVNGIVSRDAYFLKV